MEKGCDLSQYQGIVDFDLLKSKLGFVIIRASYGAADPGQDMIHYVDPQFIRNQSEARRVGMKLGYYHYSYPEYNSPEIEVDQFLHTVGKLQEGEFLCLDFEERYPDPVGWSKRFLDKVFTVTSFRPVIYLNLSTVNAYDWSPVSSDYPLWLAYWNNNPQSEMTPGIWPAGVILHQYGLLDFMNADGDTAFQDLSHYGLQPKPLIVPDTPITPISSSAPVAHTISFTGSTGAVELSFKRFFVDVQVPLNVRTSPHVIEKYDNGKLVETNRVKQPTVRGCITPPFHLEVYGIEYSGDTINGNSIWLKTWRGNWVSSAGTNYDPNNLQVT